MKIRIIKGVSGYRPDGSPYRYSVGSVVITDDYISNDLLKHGLAVIDDSKPLERPIAEAPNITPSIDRSIVVNAVVKRGRKPKQYV